MHKQVLSVISSATFDLWM